MSNFYRVVRFGVLPLVAFMCLLVYAPRAQAQKVPPCCTITKIDMRSGLVTAVVKQSGESFEFRVTDANLLKSLKVGQGVYANFATHQVSVNGIQPCCKIISQAPLAGGTSLPPAPPAGNATGQANPPSPCCAITAINAETGIVAAEENATRRIFSFQVTDASLLKSLHIGQGVYANFSSRQVSLDGKTACCTIVSGTGASGAPEKGPAPGASPTPTPTPGTDKAKPTKPSKADPQATGTPTIKPGENDTGGAIRGQAAPVPPPRTASPSAPAKWTPQGRPVPTIPVFSREPAQIRILAQGKGWNLQTVTGTVGGRLVKDEALYHIVGKEGISESPIPAQIKNELLRDAANSRENDTVYIVHKSSAETAAALLAQRSSGSTPPPSNSVTQTGSSDNGCNDMFGWGNHVNRTASISFSIPGDLLMLDLNDVGKKYVNVSGTLQIKAPASGHLSGEIGLSVLDSFCQPIGFKFRFLHVTGDMEISPSLDLDAEVGTAYQFKARQWELKLGEHGFFIGPIPVVIGFDAFLEGRLDIKVPNLAHVTYSAHGNGRVGLDAQCDMNGCSATPSGSFTWSGAGNVTLLAQGVRVVVKPGELAGVEAYLYKPQVINSHVGVEPYVKGDFWAYSGTCAEHGADASNGSYEKALTADLDGGFDVLAGIDASGMFPNGFFAPLLNQEFTLYNWEKHLLFRDLIGSTALTPLVKTDPPAYATYPETVQVGMRSCYPYTKDKDGNPLTITYRAAWGDGTPESSVHAQSPADASAAHSWAIPGQYTATFRPERDSHGREFPMQATQVAMEVKAGLPPPVRRLRNGNTLEVPSTPVPNPVSQSLESIGATLAASRETPGDIALSGADRIQPDLNVFITPNYLKQGESVTGRVALKTAAGANGVEVDLTTDSADAISFPQKVTVPANQKYATFSIGNRVPVQTKTAKVTAVMNRPGQPAATANASVIVGGNSAMTAFSRSQQGFEFPNYWQGQMYVDIPLIGRVDLGSTSYGLCGGMSAAAADAFFAHTSVPQDTSTPASGTSLRSYIYNRQMDSFRDDNAYLIRTMIEWMPLPIRTEGGVTGLQVRSDREFEGHIRPELDQGRPIPVALLKASVSVQQLTTTGPNSALFQNHQVLAVGYSEHIDHWDIHIYDPNFSTLQTLHTGPHYQTELGGTAQTASFRALFAIPYSPKQPTWDGGTSSAGGPPTNKAGVITVQSTQLPNLISQHLHNIDANPDHLPDLVPSLGPDPAVAASCYYDPRTESCQQGCPPFTARTPLGVKNRTQYAVTGPILVTLQDMTGNTIRTWTVNGLPGYGEALPGYFSYQAYFCPTGTNSAYSGPPTPNHVLLVSPPSGVTELQTNNNSAQIYIEPDATISP